MGTAACQRNNVKKEKRKEEGKANGKLCARAPPFLRCWLFRMGRWERSYIMPTFLGSFRAGIFLLLAELRTFRGTESLIAGARCQDVTRVEGDIIVYVLELPR